MIRKLKDKIKDWWNIKICKRCIYVKKGYLDCGTDDPRRVIEIDLNQITIYFDENIHHVAVDQIFNEVVVKTITNGIIIIEKPIENE